MKFIEIKSVPTVDDLVNLLANSHDALFVITGMPGSGKTYLSLLLGRVCSDRSRVFDRDQPAILSLDEWCVSRDSVGRSGWFLDPDRVSSSPSCSGAAVISGICDNLAESIPFLAAHFGKSRVVVIILQRDWAPFRRTHRLRALVDTPFRSHYVRFSQWSRGTYLRSRRKARATIVGKIAERVDATLPSGSLSFYDMESPEDPAQFLKAWA